MASPRRSSSRRCRRASARWWTPSSQPNPDPGQRTGRDHHMTGRTINAHITGTVWKIEVKPGDRVAEGTVVVILESMKMEMPVEAEEEGEILEILVKEGQSVAEGAPVVRVK